MNNLGPQAAAVLLRRSPTVVVCPTAEYKAPNYICYDYICRFCPKEDQGNQIVYVPQASDDPQHDGPAPRVYNRFYYDHRYQVYAVNRYEMPPQQSRARICSFWCRHDIDSSPPLQRTWYYVPWGNPIRCVLQDDGNGAYTDPRNGRTYIYPPPVGFVIHPEANGPLSGSEASVSSVQSEVSIETPSIGGSSLRSGSSGSSSRVLTPRSTYVNAVTYRLPAIPHAEGGVDRGEHEELRRGGALFVAELVDTERTPTRDASEGGGDGGADTPAPRRAIAGRGGVNGLGIANMNVPPGPRDRGAVRSQNRGHGGRPTRIWNWHN
ncbi:hypothetical protein NHQ30_007407 [Ciborinia camelliae]|nr:hypothetical protein NHQ30_007407 [Ciborinia camelliae]